MRYLLLALMMVLPGTSASAEEPSARPPASSDELRVEDLPEPVTDLLEKLQQLSRKIEPEITYMDFARWKGSSAHPTRRSRTHQTGSADWRPKLNPARA